MGIGIDRYYHVYDNTTYYRDYWADAVSPPPENATNVKECGCYIVEERVWVTYTTYRTYHCLCKNHMNEYRSKKKD